MSTRLTPTKHYPREPIAGCALRVYSNYHALLSLDALALLGAPEAVAIEVDDAGFSIVPTTLSDPCAIKLYRRRSLSIGVIAAALKDMTFPMTIELLVDDGRLRFGEASA